jgi:hypothetical protein
MNIVGELLFLRSLLTVNLGNPGHGQIAKKIDHLWCQLTPEQIVEFNICMGIAGEELDKVRYSVGL